MRYRITAPEPVSGGICGVGFANGQAVADGDRHRRALAYFRQAGYRVEPEAPPAEPAVEAEAPAAQAEDEGDAPFDPAQHTVDEVNEYLDSVADDEDEVMRVLLAEADGKARKTITERNAS